MRIVVTKNGTKIIEDLSINNIFDYNPDIKYTNREIIKLRLKEFKKKIIDNVSHLKKINKYKSKSLTNIDKDSEQKDINEILKDINSNKGQLFNRKRNLNNNIKIIKIKTNKKIKLPKLLEDRYILFDTMNIENGKQKNIPNILLSINSSIDKEIMKEKRIKRTKTISDINSIQIKDNEFNNNMNLMSNEYMLPTIRKYFPLKNIIDKDVIKRLNKDMKNLERNCNEEEKIFPKKNYFIKNNWENSKKNFELSLKNEINSKNINLIEYLNKDKNISNIFIQKFSKLDKEKINKLDSISKKLLYKKTQDEQINLDIKNKIKSNLMNININFRQSLDNMNNKLNEYVNIINKDKDKYLLNDKNKYLEQFMDAEKNWDKYNLERLYKKSCSPRRSAYRRLLD